MNEYSEKPKRTEPAALSQKKIGALVMIFVGAAFLFQQVGMSGGFLDNWWALFIFIPGALNLFRAFDMYNADQAITPRVRNALNAAWFPVLLGAIFLFELNWGVVWPLFLIVPALITLMSRDGDDEDEDYV